MSPEVEFKPKILGFVCHWWGYGAADMAGVSRLQYSTEAKLIRVMCTGRVDLSFVLRAFANGMDGVFVGGWRLGECNYITHGNYQATNMVQLGKKLLAHTGINPDRLRIEFMTSGEGILFAEIMNEFGKQIHDLGPLGEGEGIGEDELKFRLDEIINLVPYIKVVEKEKLALHLDKVQEYETLYTADEIDKLLNEVVSYYIDPGKCQACGICARKCPVTAIIGGKNLVHIINQDMCIKCGTCFESCPPRFGAIRKIAGEPVPFPIPEEARTIIRGGK